MHIDNDQRSFWRMDRHVEVVVDNLTRDKGAARPDKTVALNRSHPQPSRAGGV
jgi:hypothetical protein